MLRVSSYNLYIPLGNNKKEFMLINGRTGTIDVVSYKVYEAIQKAVNKSVKVEDIGQDIVNILTQRGYFTFESIEEEKDFFCNMVNSVQKLSQKYIHFTIMPTYNCNFRCSYCYERNLLKNGKEWLEAVMSDETVDKIFNYVDDLEKKDYKVNKTFTLYGGEPLLNENHDIVKYIIYKCHERDKIVKAVSNGYDLKYYEDLLGKGMIENIQFTLDGIEEYHNSKRFLNSKAPTFNTIVDNISLALDKGVDVFVRSNIDINNVNQISELTTFYNKKGWTKYENFNYYFKNVHGCYISKDLYVNENEIIDRIKESEGNYQNNNIADTIAKNLKYLLENGKAVIPRASFCGATTSMYVIDPFGDVYPCWEVVGQKDDCCIGNIRDNDITNNKIFRYWHGRTIVKITECAECPYAIFCGGGCPAHIRARKNNIYLPYCAEFKEIFNEVAKSVYSDFVLNKENL